MHYLRRRESLTEAAIRIGIQPTMQAEATHEDDIIGKKVGRVTTTRLHKKKHPARNNVYEVICECGTVEYRQRRWILNPKQKRLECCRFCQKKTAS